MDTPPRNWPETILAAVTIIALTLGLYWAIGGFRQPAEPQAGTVIVALHPGHGDGDRMCRNLQWDTALPVICPQGEGGSWNSGWEGAWSTRDDVAYLMELTAGYDRVLVYGRSQGAMMALTWACADPRVKRVAVKSGTLPKVVECVHDRAAVLHWHGELDRIIPVAGDHTIRSVVEEGLVYSRHHLKVLPGWGHAGAPAGWNNRALEFLLRKAE